MTLFNFNYQLSCYLCYECGNFSFLWRRSYVFCYNLKENLGVELCCEYRNTALDFAIMGCRLQVRFCPMFPYRTWLIWQGQKMHE